MSKQHYSQNPEDENIDTVSFFDHNQLQSLKENLAPRFNWNDTAAHSRGHYVQFYETDEFLIESIVEYCKVGDSSIIIATEAHCQSLKLVVGNNKNYTFLDAQEMLSTFMHNGLPNSELFNIHIGGLIQTLSAKHKHVRAYGEMVAVLWAEGNQEGALQLEHLWEELLKKYSFSLLCAYPLHSFNGNLFSEPFMNVCLCHSKVLPTESYSTIHNVDKRLRAIALLQQKARSLEAQVVISKKLERQKDEFLALASHELKTPLTSLKIYGQSLQKQFAKKGDVQAVGHLSKMDAQVNKLINLVSDLLDVSKIQSGKISFTMTSFNSKELLQEIIEESQLIYDNHSFVTNFADSKVVSADRDRIGQVLTNLLSNAVKYSPEASEILITTKNTDREIIVSVQDQGHGIDSKDKDKVFERFFRAEEYTNETIPGLGLGLHISREIIQRHGGTISCESERGKGSTFTFTLPL